MRWLLLLALVATAHADDAVTGFTTFGTGAMTGRVTGPDGKGLAGVKVHAASRNGERVVTTDADGNYKVELDGQTLLYVKDTPGAKLGGEQARTVSEGSDGEAIEVHATVPPRKMPVPKVNPFKIYEYTDDAIDKDVWVRAWVMLDIDEVGGVRHVKFLNRAGHGLDTVALKAAFALKFEPARDAADKPIRTLMVWPFEWPSFYWLKTAGGGEYADVLPAYLPNCRKPNDKHAETRDCSGPDMSRAFVERWIAPRK